MYRKMYVLGIRIETKKKCIETYICSRGYRNIHRKIHRNIYMLLGVCIETYIFTSQERFVCSDMYVWYVYCNMYFLMRIFISHDWFVHSNMSIIRLLYVYDIMICMFCDVYFVTCTFTSRIRINISYIHIWTYEWIVCSDKKKIAFIIARKEMRVGRANSHIWMYKLEYTYHIYISCTQGANSNLQFPIHMFASRDWFVHSDMTICPSNSLGPVWANMYSDPLSTTTPAAVGIDSPDCVKWRETLPSQEESAGRDIPVGQLVTKVLVPRESPLPPCQHWPGHNSPVPRRWKPGPDRCPHPRVDCSWWVLWEPLKFFFSRDWCGRTHFQWTC